MDLRLLEAEYLAANTIKEFGICLPEHIRIRDIAFAKGAVVVEQGLTGASASIARVGNHATIRIRPDDLIERKRFSIAHELGHLLLGHVTSIQKICNSEDMMNWHQTNHETQANFFASELILPSNLINKRCDIKNINFDPIKQIAEDFRASLTASAIKFIRLCPEKCAIVCSENSKIKWFYKSNSWWPYIDKGKSLDNRTLAYDFFHNRPMESEPAEIDADAWIGNRGVSEIIEHSVASPQYGFVLSLLWIKSF